MVVTLEMLIFAFQFSKVFHATEIKSMIPMSNFPHIFAPFPSPLREFTRTTPGALCTYGYCDAFMHLGNTYFNFFRYSVLIIVIVSNCSHASVTSFDCVHTVMFVKFWQVMVVTRIIWTIFCFYNY